MGKKRTWTDDDFVHHSANSESWSELARNLGLCASGNGCYLTLRRAAERLEVSTNHFKRKRFGSGMTTYLDYNAENLDKVLKSVNNPYKKKKLIEWGLLQNICELCGIVNQWNGMELTLQLDHIDGNNSNNDLSNLRILCPNCHTQTKTYGSKKQHG